MGWCKPSDKNKINEFKRTKKIFGHIDGDHLTLLNVYNAYSNLNYFEQKNWCQENFLNEKCLRRAYDIRKQLLSIYCKNVKENNNNNQVVIKKMNPTSKYYYDNIIKSL